MMQEIVDETFLKQLEEIQNIQEANQKKPEKKIYLFLDFDGVINVFLKPGTPEYDAALQSNQFDFANRDCITRLSQLCLDYPIWIVISSSWRFSGVEYCRQYLVEHGLSDKVHFAGTTSIDSFQKRQLDIIDFLVDHPDFNGYLILDDIPMPEFGEYAILSDPLVGYDEEMDKRARSLCTRILG